MGAPKKTSSKKRAARNQIAAESWQSRRIQGISPAAEHLIVIIVLLLLLLPLF
jgi:hypothetical protein